MTAATGTTRNKGAVHAASSLASLSVGAGNSRTGNSQSAARTLTYRVIAAIEPITRIDRSLDSRHLRIDQQSIHDSSLTDGGQRHGAKVMPQPCTWPCESTRLWPAKVRTLDRLN